MKIVRQPRHRNFAGQRFAILLPLFTLLLPAFAAAGPPPDRRATLKFADEFQSSGQKYACTLDYPEKECLAQLNSLRDQLAAYHAEDLGGWTWILVSAATWKPLLQGLGRPTDSPAMTSYIDRVTLFEQSLFARPNTTQLELERHYHLPLDELVVRTITHEMGHAYCGDPDEQRTEEVAQQIRRGLRPGCRLFGTPPLEKTAANSDRQAVPKAAGQDRTDAQRCPARVLCDRELQPDSASECDRRRAARPVAFFPPPPSN